MVIQLTVILPNKENTGYMSSKQDLIHPLYTPNLTLLMCHISGDPLKNKGLSEGALSITLSFWRKSTQRQYIPYLNKFRRYCCSRQFDSLFSTCGRKVNFLAVLYDEGIGYTGCIKKLNKFEIDLNFAKQLVVSSFCYI
jgi:hypothetical protein